MPAHLNVVDFPVPEYLNPVTCLRNIADDIEAGKFGEVGTVAIVLFGDTMESSQVARIVAALPQR